MKTKFLFISSLLLLGVLQTVNAQSNHKKALQGIAARKEKREKQAAMLHAKVSEQKAQQAFEKPVTGAASLPNNNGNGSGQRVGTTLPPKAEGTPPAKQE